MSIQISCPSGFKLINIIDSGNFSERYSQVVLGNRWPIFIVEVPNIVVGDVLHAIGHGEVTTSRNTNTEFVWQLKLHDYSTGQSWEMSEERGVNIDLSRHHEVVFDDGLVQALTSGTQHVIWWWGAFDGSQSPPYIEVGGGGSNWQDYGRLRVFHYRC